MLIALGLMAGCSEQPHDSGSTASGSTGGNGAAATGGSSGGPSCVAPGIIGTSGSTGGIVSESSSTTGGLHRASYCSPDGGTALPFPRSTSSDGTFELSVGTSYPSLTFSEGTIATSDFNEDGDLDVALAASSDGGAVVIPGNGDGTFGQPIALPFATGMGIVTSSDFNRDGHADLAYAGSDFTTISVAFGHGDGTFDPPNAYALPVPDSGAPPQAVTSLTPIDFDHDGLNDLLVVAGTISLMKGLPDAGFEVSPPLAGGYQAQRALPLDLDCDGQMDLVATGGLGGELLFGNADGGFTLADGFTIPGGVQNQYNKPVVADFNADGIPDVFLDGRLMRGRGDGTLLGPFLMPAFPGETEPGQLADFNGDGLPDLLWNWNGERVAFGDLGLGFTIGAKILGVSNTSSIALGDFDGDGNVDLVAASRSPRVGFSLRVSLAHHGQAVDAGLPDAGSVALGACEPLGDAGAGVSYDGPPVCGSAESFGGWASITGLAARPVATAMADFDGDGASELAQGAWVGVTVTSSCPGGEMRIDGYPVHGGGPLTTFDVDGDGHPEIVTTPPDGEPGTLTTLWVADGGGAVHALTSQIVSPARALRHADMNNDGIEDLISIGGTAPVAEVRLGHGDGRFDLPLELPVGGDAVAVADFNRDGNQDLLVVRRFDNQAFELLGDGELGFTARQPFTPCDVPAVSVEATAVEVADLDRDGSPDAVVLCGTGPTVLRGRGDGTFAAPRTYLTGSPSSVSLADVDGDGRLDALVTDYPHHVTVLRGLPDAEFGTGRGFIVEYPWSTRTGDFNGDGKQDLVVIGGPAPTLILGQ